jgi:hypothetical protein
VPSPGSNLGMLFATLFFENAFLFYSEKGFAILIKSWKITFGE